MMSVVGWPGGSNNVGRQTGRAWPVWYRNNVFVGTAVTLLDHSYLYVKGEVQVGGLIMPLAHVRQYPSLHIAYCSLLREKFSW